MVSGGAAPVSMWTRTEIETAISSAVNRLLHAGMVLRYRSASGSSYYLGWPGRLGVLRVSDHANKERDIDPRIFARLTIHENSMPKDMERAIAVALGQYLLKAPEKRKCDEPE